MIQQNQRHYGGLHKYPPQNHNHVSLEERQDLQRSLHNFLHEERIKESLDVLNPMNVCPNSMVILFPVTDHTVIGVGFSDFRKMVVGIRQSIDPSGDIVSIIGILEFRIPFPLNLLVMFSSLGLFLSGAAEKVSQQTEQDLAAEIEQKFDMLEQKLGLISQDAKYIPAKIEEIIAEQHEERIKKAVNPTNICPSGVVIYFPIYKTHTRIGATFSDFNNVSVSIRQTFEPNNNIDASFTFLRLRVPIPLNLLAMFLAIGLFFARAININMQESLTSIKSDIQSIISKLKSN